MKHNAYAILHPMDFIKDVQKEAIDAKKRIYFQAMEVEPGEISNTFFKVLEDGAKRHLDTKLHIDYYSLLVTEGMFNYLPLLSKKKRHARKKRLTERKTYFDHLKSLGVTILFTNPPNLLSKIIPLFGRNHIKIAIIDDIAYIGGINFHDDNFKSNDCMVKLSDPHLVEAILKIYIDIEKGRLRNDREVLCTDESRLLVDGGKIARSIILKKAAEIVTNAEKSVKIITPIIPDTALSKAITTAKNKNLPVKIIVPSLQKMQGVYFFLDAYNQLLLFLQMKHLPITYLNQPIHAKMIIIDDTTVLLGSHNFTSRGVVLGTEELAILSTNPYMVEQANIFFERVAGTRSSSAKEQVIQS